MAKWAGYEDQVEFALVVEGWTQAERRDFLSGFYRSRREILSSGVGGGKQKAQDEGQLAPELNVKREVKSESGDDEL